jgi:hypothetical protein
MASLEPSIVTVPLFRTDIYTHSTRVGSTSTTIATKTTAVVASSTAMAAATDSPALLQTPTGIPPLPSAFDSPLATGQVHTPTVAVVTLVAVIVCALILLIALCYSVFLCFRGKCSQCPQYEDELKKYKEGTLKHITSAMVQKRPHNCDLEKGLSPFDEQAEQYKLRMHAESLDALEGRVSGQTQEHRTVGDRALQHLRTSQLRAATGQRDSGYSSDFATFDKNHEPKDFEKKSEQLKVQAFRIDVQEPVAVHSPLPVGHNAKATPVADPALRNPNFKGTFEEYERDILAHRERERKAQSIAGWLDIANDPSTPEPKALRAMVQASAKMATIDSDEAQTKKLIVTPRQPRHSRFKERFSAAAESYNGSI